MPTAPCNNPIGGFTPASEVVVEQFGFFTDLVIGYINTANQFSQVLQDFNIVPIELQEVQWAVPTYSPFDPPTEPGEFTVPNPNFSGTDPSTPTLLNVNVTGLDLISAPTDEPVPLPITLPTAPVVTLPDDPGNAPVIGDTTIPVYTGGALPEVPTLYMLNLPNAPDINLEELDVARPDFIPPNALSDQYTADLHEYQDVIRGHVNTQVNNTGVTDMHARLQEMLAGGTGLPVTIEQALFDRAIGREEVSSIQAVRQAEEEWSAKGFTLPGSTLLARTQEIRQANRVERGRINRELSIQFHQQEIENLRFSVQQAVQLEGVLLTAHIQIFDIARQLADGHWDVAKGIYDSQLAIFSLYLEIYRTDVEVYKQSIEIELAKLEVYRSQLEGQRLVSTINQQLVDIYNAELQGVLANVEVFKAEVQGAEAAIRAELSRIEVFKTEIDAYTARLGAVQIESEIYNTQINAEQLKAQIYATQVDAFGRRIEAYRAEVGAEATKIEATTGVNNARTQLYAEQVRAWEAGIRADTANLEAFVEVYRANIQKYEALLSREQYRVLGESRNTELNVEYEKARVASVLKQADQSIEQLRHISTLGLSATETAARINSQLAASAMAAISVSASMSTNNTLSAADNTSCSSIYTTSVTA
jgi:hypothetical protein